nr:epithelial-stromal interaction protein 1 [Misgurnus anguillicaudatus]
MNPSRNMYPNAKVNQMRNNNDSEVNQYDNEQRNTPTTSNVEVRDQPKYADGYTLIPPNKSKHSELQRIVQKDEEVLRRWKEENRPGPIQLDPMRLGGAVSLAEVRQKQQQEARFAKTKKKLQKEDTDRKKREREEEEMKRMKAEQREKAIKLEARRKEEEQSRQDLYQQDHRMKNMDYLKRMKSDSSTVSMAASNSIPATSWAKCHEYRESKRQEDNAALLEKKAEQRRKTELLEEKQKREEEERKRQIESDRQRVNLAFLNRLEAVSLGRVSEPVANPPVTSNVYQDDDDEDEGPTSSAGLNPSQAHRDSGAQEDCDHMWAVMKLQHNFPYYERDMLEDIVRQCNGNYQQAYELLNV